MCCHTQGLLLIGNKTEAIVAVLTKEVVTDDYVTNQQIAFC